ncbi:hypothetical protein WJE61_003676 [Klebsiella pneumoniae]
MTDITELAQREKFEAWFKSSFHPDKTGPYIKDQLYFAWKAAGAELVEALESEKRICATWRKTAEANSEKLEKAQQQMTESENRVRKQNRHICELFDDNTALRQRIAGLEARTVKLPDLRQIVSGDRYVWSDGVYNYSQDVKVVLDAAGIKVEDE